MYPNYFVCTSKWTIHTTHTGLNKQIAVDYLHTIYQFCENLRIRTYERYNENRRQRNRSHKNVPTTSESV